jgi:hypothetical protein
MVTYATVGMRRRGGAAWPRPTGEGVLAAVAAAATSGGGGSAPGLAALPCPGSVSARLAVAVLAGGSNSSGKVIANGPRTMVTIDAAGSSA